MAGTGRLAELFCAVSVTFATIAGTATLIFWRRTILPDYSLWCGPSYMDFSVNITGTPLEGDTYHWTDGGITFPPGTFWTDNNGYVFGCPCSRKRCLRKCCKQDIVFNSSEECAIESISTNVEAFIMNVYSSSSLKPKVVNDKYFYILHGMSCEGEMSILDSKPYLLDDGRVFTNRPVGTYLDQAHYCLESYEEDNSTIVVECSEKKLQMDKWIIVLKAYGMVASVPFLLGTLLVYALVPSLRNLHGKSVMCHVFCLTILYVTNATIHLYQDQIGKDNMDICITMAYVLQFAYLTTFFWLNVMCFDIWRVFSKLSAYGSTCKGLHQKKFLIYSCYAWGGPALVSLVTAVMDLSPNVPPHYVKPQMGVMRCWFNGFDAMLLYVYLPMGVLLILNLLMFITTAYRLRAHETQSKMLRTGGFRQHYNNSTLRFKLYAKLFAVMGINWILEVVSFMFEDYQLLWLVSDVGNTLHGITIFYLLICKRSILDKLLSKIGIETTDFSVKTSWVSCSSRSSTVKNQSRPRCLQTDPGLSMTELRNVVY